MEYWDRQRERNLSARHPLPRIRVQTLAAVFFDNQRFAELQAHLFVVGHEIWLDDDHHVLAKDQFSRVVAFACFGLKDRRILVYAVDHVVIGAIAALVDDLRSFFGFRRGRAIFDDSGQDFETFHCRVMHFLPLRRGPFADGKSSVDLPTVT